MLQLENDPSLDVRKRKVQLWSRSEVVLRWCGERERQGISTTIGFFFVFGDAQTEPNCIVANKEVARRCPWFNVFESYLLTSMKFVCIHQASKCDSFEPWEHL